MTDYRGLPSVDRLGRSPLLAEFPERVRVAAARKAVAQLRKSLDSGPVFTDAEELALSYARELHCTGIPGVLNASGVVLHTGLGRARLAKAAEEAVSAAAHQHVAVELDLESGQRGDRQEHVAHLLQVLTGAEDSLVVNNAAAGVFLVLNELCAGREVILSRGQMVEIGGSFRMPDIIRQSGCILREVGCTNKTRLNDYEEACGESSTILHCHQSNYKIVGFTSEPSLSELAQLAKSRSVRLIDDQGTGCLIEPLAYGLPAMPTLPQSVQSGADVSIASGDKMLGGPQCGLIVGRRDLIERIRKNPLARVLRVDKLTLAALRATLQLYTEGRESEIPTVRYITRPLEEVREAAEALASAYGPGSEVQPGVTEIGGGSAPGTGVPTYRTGISVPDLEAFAKDLRCGEPSILGRIERDRFWLDPRTLEHEEIELAADLLAGFTKASS